MKNKIYMGILVTYLLAFLYPLLYTGVLYQQFLNLAEKDSQYSNMSSLKSCSDFIDRKLAETQNLTLQISDAASTSNLLFSANPYQDSRTIARMSDFRDTLESYLCANNFISDLFVIFKKPGFIVGSNTNFFATADFYGSFFQYSHMPASQWNALVFNTGVEGTFLPVDTVKRYKQTDSMLVYLKGFPDFTGADGTIVVLIPESQLVSLIDNSYLEKYGWFMIVDNKNRPILSYNNGLNGTLPEDMTLNGSAGKQVIRVDGQKYLLSYTTSANNGWKYVGVLPYSVVMQKAIVIRRLTLIMMFACIGTGLLGIAAISYRKSLHVKRLAGLLFSKLNVSYVGRNSDIHLIDQSITGILDDNTSLKAKIELQMPMLRNTLVERILKKEFVSETELERTLQQFGLTPLPGKLLVICTKIEPLEEVDASDGLSALNEAQFYLDDALNGAFSGYYVYNEDFSEYYYILSVGDSGRGTEQERIDALLDGICQALYEKYNVRLRISVGTPFDKLLDTPHSYNAAKEAADYNILVGKKNVIWYADIEEREDRFYYPLELELQMQNHIKDGNAQMVKNLAEHIRQENLTSRQLSSYMAKSLINELYTSLLNVSNILKLEESREGKRLVESILKMERRNGTLDFVFAEYERFCCEICDLVKNARMSRVTSPKISRILGYIGENYRDINLSLTSVAEKFGFASPYLSKIFKENTGENFSVYLENLRIRQSCKLLLECDSIEEVSRRVGYNSINAYRKTFKNIMKMTPSEYRFQQRQQE